MTLLQNPTPHSVPYPWLEKEASRLLPQKEQWPHAWLISGPEGIGKYALARWMASALLCEAPTQHGPCGTCISCTWLAQHTHPDYYACLPESVATPNFTFLGYAESDWIKLDAIRALQARLYLPPHRQRAKVVLIYPAELLNTAASNALLKLLEEPPVSTTFLLIAHRPHLILPTLRSRCNALTLATPTPSLAQTWCKEHAVSNDLLAESGNCPLKALALKDQHEAFNPLLKQLFNPETLDIDTWKAWIDRVPKAERKTALVHAIDALHKTLHDWLCVHHNHEPRFFPSQHTVLSTHLNKISIPKLLNLDHDLKSVRQHSKHPLNPVWVLEDLILRYVALWS